MTAKTLEGEAREAAEKYRVSCGLDAVGPHQLTHEVIGYAQGFFDAATLRDKEIEELRKACRQLEWNAAESEALVMAYEARMVLDNNKGDL